MHVAIDQSKRRSPPGGCCSLFGGFATMATLHTTIGMLMPGKLVFEGGQRGEYDVSQY